MKLKQITKKILSLVLLISCALASHTIEARRHHRKKSSGIGWGLGGFALGAGLGALFSSKTKQPEPELVYYDEYEPYDRYETVVYEPARRIRSIRTTRPVQVMRPSRAYRPSVSFGLTVPITNHSYFNYSSGPLF